MSAYYNENDPKTAAWLRELIRHGTIAHGDVDERSIEDILPSELAGYTQHHFFAGIGGWSYALRLARWPDDKPVWTGSCPCQPFSAAGKGGGFSDERHLWPAWFHLIRQCKPRVIFGEQVASALDWVDLVHTDLETEGYTFAAIDLCAASVGAPHIRQRLYFVADTGCERRQQISRSTFSDEKAYGRKSYADNLTPSNGADGWLADAYSEHKRPTVDKAGDRESRGCGEVSIMEHPTGYGRVERRPESSARGIIGGRSESGLADTVATGREGSAPRGLQRIEFTQGRGVLHAAGEQMGVSRRTRIARSADFWSDCDWIECTDGKSRPIEPGTFPLAARLPARVGLLRGYGNAIVPQVAAAFIEAYMSYGMQLRGESP